VGNSGKERPLRTPPPAHCHPTQRSVAFFQA